MVLTAYVRSTHLLLRLRRRIHSWELPTCSLHAGLKLARRSRTISVHPGRSGQVELFADAPWLPKFAIVDPFRLLAYLETAHWWHGKDRCQPCHNVLPRKNSKLGKPGSSFGLIGSRAYEYKGRFRTIHSLLPLTGHRIFG
jgi:hypothetical protein